MPPAGFEPHNLSRRGAADLRLGPLAVCSFVRYYVTTSLISTEVIGMTVGSKDPVLNPDL